MFSPQNSKAHCPGDENVVETCRSPGWSSELFSVSIRLCFYLSFPSFLYCPPFTSLERPSIFLVAPWTAFGFFLPSLSLSGVSQGSILMALGLCRRFVLGGTFVPPLLPSSPLSPPLIVLFVFFFFFSFSFFNFCVVPVVALIRCLYSILYFFVFFSIFFSTLFLTSATPLLVVMRDSFFFTICVNPELPESWSS